MTQTISSPDARTFLRANNAVELHPALNTTGLDYDPSKDQWTGPSLGRSSVQGAGDYGKRHFTTVMERFEREYPPSIKDPTRTFRGAHSWKDVLSVASSAVSEYEGRAHGVRRFFRNVSRKLGDYNEAAGPLLDQILPSGEYTSLVCGAIVVIFKAFAQYNIKRKEMMDMLGDSVEILECAESLVQIYRDDTRLEERAIRLFVALVAVIDEIILWFDSGAKKWLLVIPQQGLYAKSFNVKKSALGRATAQLKELADILDKEKTVQIFEAFQTFQVKIDGLLLNANGSLTKIDAVRSILDQDREERRMQHAESQAQNDRIIDVTERSDERIDHLHTTVEQTNEKLDEHHSEVREELRHMHAEIRQKPSMMITLNCNVINVFQTQLTHGQRDLEWYSHTAALQKAAGAHRNTASAQRASQTADEDRRRAEVAQWSKTDHRRRCESGPALQPMPTNAQGYMLLKGAAPRPSYVLTTGEAIRLLDNCHTLAADDVKHYLDLSRAVSFDTQLARDLTSAPTFRKWYASALSQILFVFPDVPSSINRPGSVITAMVYQALLELSPATGLAFFCSRRISSATENPLADMLAQIISQLLASREIDLTQWSDLVTWHEHYDGLHARRLEYLLSFFKYLVTKGLAWGTIFLLVDDFWNLEASTDPILLQNVLDYLAVIVGKCAQSDRSILKIVFMTPSRHSSAMERADVETKLRITPRKHNGGGPVNVRDIGLALQKASVTHGVTDDG
ncbi:hypothetical protein LTR85_011944 [Meristemomyces frigidus]|nr:hypothetical protein LTR85_011944 [Meristemomyces frigidus]